MRRVPTMRVVHKWRRMVDAGGVASKSGDQKAEFVSPTLAPGLAVASEIHRELPSFAAGQSGNRGERDLVVECVRPMRRLAARDPQVIRVDSLWLAIKPLDMRAGTEAALARVVRVREYIRPVEIDLELVESLGRRQGMGLAPSKFQTGKQGREAWL